MKPKIIYEDKQLLVCVKPAGMATQTSRLAEPDLVSLLKNHLAAKGESYLGVVHRLDQPVSGLLVFAKTKEAAADLSRQLGTGTANKYYYACCAGIPEEAKGKLVHYLARDGKSNLARIVEEGNRDGKRAELQYFLEEKKGDCSILRIELMTGRFHQIRAQLSAIGHPLLGDRKYGTEKTQRLSREKGIRFVALCAYRLEFRHPKTGKNMEFLLSGEDLPAWN